jgi:hypothetical protein
VIQTVDGGELAIQQGLYLQSVNLWGTTNPWRQDAMYVLADQGVWPTGWYDPIIPSGEERPGNIYVEVHRAHTNGYDATLVGPENKGLLSKIELGHTMVKAALGGTDAYIQLDRFTGDDEASIRARMLVLTAVDHMAALLPAGLFHVADPLMAEAERQAMFHGWLQKIGSRIVHAQQSGNVWTLATPPLLQAQPLGHPQVFLSGTSVEASEAKNAFTAEAARRGLPVVDAYTGATFSEADMRAEYQAMGASQVSAVMITNNTETKAGTAEATIRAALAAMNLNRRSADGAPLQQAFGLYIEEPDEAKLSRYAVEMRRALLLHVQAIRKRFPGAIRLAQSPAELAAWAHRSTVQ